MGKPDEQARNVTVGFRDYIKNVCAAAADPFWPQAALEAVVYSRTSLALNRFFTGWYKRKGFDITCDAGYDQKYIPDGQTYESINELVDKIFNRYIRQEDHSEPFFDSGGGMWHADAVKMAEQGYNALEIIRRLLRKDLQIIETYNIKGAGMQYPGYPLREGMTGEHVKHLQQRLYYIGRNCPSLPAVHDEGYFGPNTAAAVRAFLNSETGIVDKQGWYKICCSGAGKRNAPEFSGARRNVELFGIVALALISKIRNSAKITRRQDCPDAR